MRISYNSIRAVSEKTFRVTVYGALKLHPDFTVCVTPVDRRTIGDAFF